MTGKKKKRKKKEDHCGFLPSTVVSQTVWAKSTGVGGLAAVWRDRTGRVGGSVLGRGGLLEGGGGFWFAFFFFSSAI